jgi:hypothetical protein
MILSFAIEHKKSFASISMKSVSILLILFIFSGFITPLTVKTTLYGVSTYEYYINKSQLGPSNRDDIALLRSVVNKNEQILQLPFNLNFYVWADRLPASGIFYWLPWMNEYAKNPIPGYPLDLCKQMKERPPKAIFYTNSAIWEYQPHTFMSCFKTLLKKHYLMSSKLTNVWFRDDVALNNPKILSTSIVPEDFYDPSLTRKETHSLNGLKLHFVKLSEKNSKLCALIPKNKNDTLILGNCESRRALLVSFNKEKNKIVTSDGQCLDLENGNGALRIWPCMETPYQIFSKEINMDWFYIKNSIQKSCLTIHKNRIIQNDCNGATKWQFKE